jgi:hypothetical protein
MMRREQEYLPALTLPLPGTGCNICDLSLEEFIATLKHPGLSGARGIA